MTKPPGPYGIGAVVRLTGLSRHAIRVWERRHGAIKPERTPSGVRRYSQVEVERLKLLRDAIGAGHRISAIADLDDQEIKALLPETPMHNMASILERMRDAARNFDRPSLEQLLTREALALGPFEFCRSVVSPLLDRIGEAWSDSESCMAEEHMAFATIKGILMSLLRFSDDRIDGPTMLFSTLPGEHHEFGALMAAV
ncbi:MAG: MerR family transcriptional regulator, partial [Geminicoccaceae bacterium]